MAGRVAGKVAIVTGAGRGMGRAIAELLVEEGASVIGTDVAFGERHAGDTEFDGKLHLMQHDVRSEADWQAVVAEAERRFGPVTVLVNNAGVIRWNQPIVDLEVDDFQFTMDVNVKGTFLGMKHAVPSMRRAGIGSIVNFSSTAGFVGMAGVMPYVTSKFAVRGMTKSAALEFGPHNIRANSVHPGGVNTDMMAGNSNFAPQAINRLADPRELAHLVLYLASDDSSYSTGAEFIADGGRLAGSVPRPD